MQVPDPTVEGPKDSSRNGVFSICQCLCECVAEMICFTSHHTCNLQETLADQAPTAPTGTSKDCCGVRVFLLLHSIKSHHTFHLQETPTHEAKAEQVQDYVFVFSRCLR